MEAGIIAEVDNNMTNKADLESEKLQELVDVLEMELPAEAESLRSEIAVLERLQEQEETDAIIEVFDDSSPSGGSSSSHTYVTTTTVASNEMKEMGFPESMIQTVMRNLSELKNKVKYSVGNMEMFAEMNELNFDPKVIEEVMGNISDRIEGLS